MHAALDAGGVRALVVPTDRADNVARHREAWDAIASAIELGSGRAGSGA
jgi:hypothetical protein